MMGATPSGLAGPGTSGSAGTLDSNPRTAALRWFAAAYLLILGMSFLILPRGPISPLYGMIWLRGPLFVLSGLALLWLGTLHLSRRGAVTAHLLAAAPPLAVGASYIHLQAYGPAAMLLLLGVAVALAPFASPRPLTTAWRPDALGLVLGLGIAAQGADLLVRSQPPVVPYGLQGAIGVAFLVFGLAVAGTHIVTGVPVLLSWPVHVAAGASVVVLCVIIAIGVSPVLWVLNTPSVLAGLAALALPWLSPRMVRIDAHTARARLAIGLFTGALVPLLIAVPAVLALRDATGDGATDATKQAAFGVTLLLSIVAAFAGWLLARQLVVPLSRLGAGVERIAAGERGVALTSDGPREIEELAVAVESMAARLDEHAAQEERDRLARDLHDSITQALFAAALKAEALAEDEGLSERSAETAEQVRRLTRGALAQMRTLLLELRSESLANVPIEQLLRTVVEAAEGRSSVAVDLRLRCDCQPPHDLHTAIYRVTQEALNNVTRHAGARRASVDLRSEPSGVRLLIHDDGCGFDPGPVSQTHFGLRSMRERATEAGAELRIVSAPDEGTLVMLDWRDAAAATPSIAAPEDRPAALEREPAPEREAAPADEPAPA
jgi:signal transduction histidine kinase